MAPPAVSAKDSMKSTWRTADKSQWNIYHRILYILNAFSEDIDRPVPVHAMSDKIPFVSSFSQHVWILSHAGFVLGLHQGFISATGWRVPWWAATIYYTAAFLFIVMRVVHTIRTLAHRHGFLDGCSAKRDGVPDSNVAKVVDSGWKTTGGRILMAVLLTYNDTQSPLDAMSVPSWWAWLPFQVGMYSVVLDFWFYWYHRAMHDIDGLWQFHRRHHLTKHPNPMLAAYADDVQEFFDMVGIPFMTYLTFKAFGIPLGFYDWFVCHQYVAFIETGGHSGLRLHIQAATPFQPLLNYFDAEIVIEDHDLHHRKGWRKSNNYGKQTRLWDRVFGTCFDRIESKASNIDYENPAVIPLKLWY